MVWLRWLRRHYHKNPLEYYPRPACLDAGEDDTGFAFCVLRARLSASAAATFERAALIPRNDGVFHDNAVLVFGRLHWLNWRQWQVISDLEAELQ